MALGGGACGGDDTVPLEPVSYELSITQYNGQEGDVISPYCDRTLSVTVQISPENTFALRPLNACGTSARCGYVHFELLQGGEVVSTADSVTRQGVLRLPDLTRLDDLKLQVSLRSGVNQETIVNADDTEAMLTVPLTLEPPGSCEDPGTGGAGGAGAGGQPSEPAAGASGEAGAAQGGQGGEAPQGGQGGQGGAALGGEAGIAGAGGA